MSASLGVTVAAVERLLPAAGDAPEDWRILAAGIASALTPGAAPALAPAPPWPTWDRPDGPLVLGVAGAQGSGKSTLAQALARALGAAGARAAAASLDDFYLSHVHRAELAQRVHPLLATRGVPGTHDVALLEQVIEALGGRGSVALPVFDKGADDPLPRGRWRQVTAPLDVFVLEGWCVGAVPESPAALRAPVNELEALEDAEGSWRCWVNAQLGGAYQALWARLHGLVFLQVPDVAAVLRWRTEQEQALPAAQRMSDTAVARFVAHYQRLTTAMLREMPRRADLVVRLDVDHRVVELRRRPHSA